MENKEGTKRLILKMTRKRYGEKDKDNEKPKSKKSKETIIGKAFYCPECSESYSRADYVKDHLLFKHLNFEYTCKCGLLFRFRNHFRQHFESNCSVLEKNKYKNQPELAALKRNEIYERQLKKGDMKLSKLAIKNQWSVNDYTKKRENIFS